MDTPPILGGLSKGKYSTMLINEIRTPDIWTANDGVRVVYPRASKSLQYRQLKLQSIIYRYLVGHMEVWLLDSDMLGKCGVFWPQLSAYI